MHTDNLDTMTVLSATELSRLHRQRRLESKSPMHRASPATISSIQRRSRKEKESQSKSGQCNSDEAGKSLVNASVSYSFDEEVTAATSSSSNSVGPTEIKVKNNNNNNQVAIVSSSVNVPLSQRNRSLSFSSFSMPATSLADRDQQQHQPRDPEGFVSPSSQTNIVAAVTPDSATPIDVQGPRNGNAFTSPVSSLRFFLDSHGARGTPKPGSLSRSSSTKSMPLALADAESFDSDVPMDELMAGGSSRGMSSRNHSRLPPSMRRSLMDTPLLTEAGFCGSGSNVASPETTTLALLPRSTSSTELTVPTPSPNLHRMAEALQLRVCPALMTADEQHLWDVVQNLVNGQNKNDSGAKDSNGSDAAYWEQKYRHAESEWKEQQKESDKAVRAIQRVLADVSSEREQTVVKLQEDLQRTQDQRDDTILKLTHKLKEMKQEISTMKQQQQDDEGEASCTTGASNSSVTGGSTEDDTTLDSHGEVADLKRQLKELQDAQTGKSRSSTSVNDQEVLQLREANARQAQEIADLKEHMVATRPESRAGGTVRDQDDLLQELHEKNASLENAKMIIASLENANGSLARELRAKLKEKEDELSNLTSTSADRKRTLDSLATELRELQRQQQKPRMSKKQIASQKSLCQLLEKNVKTLRKAAVQHEAMNDQKSVDQISQIVSETFTSLKHNLESWDAYLKNMDVPELQDDNDGSSGPFMESALAKKHDETKTLRKELDRIQSDSSQEIEKLTKELQTVKDQLNVHIEMLAKKDQELTVLRDSLNLEDENGYISDDVTEAFDEPENPAARSNLDGFSGSLLLNGGSGIHSANPNAAEMSDATAAEIQMLKNEIIQQQKERESNAAKLRAEKESLANAKMIISSLEKANKSMLEDLRSRLQDSNTAIASLLEKSMEHEKTIDGLRKELESVRQERETDGKKAEAKMAKLRDENLVFSMRLASKDREVEDLQDTLSQYEGHEVHISKMRLSSVEEKKEDPASDDELLS